MSVSVQYMRLVRMLRMLRLLKVLKIFNVLRDLFRSAQTHLIDSFSTNFLEGGFRSPRLRDFGKNGVKIIQETTRKSCCGGRVRGLPCATQAANSLT